MKFCNGWVQELLIYKPANSEHSHTRKGKVALLFLDQLLNKTKFKTFKNFQLRDCFIES